MKLEDVRITNFTNEYGHYVLRLTHEPTGKVVEVWYDKNKYSEARDRALKRLTVLVDGL